jgi:hypothetical protein
MNVPGTIDGNWRWRIADASLSRDALDRLRGPTEAGHRRSNRRVFPPDDDASRIAVPPQPQETSA